MLFLSLIYIYEAKYEPGDCDPICKPTTLSHLRISSKKTLFMETEVNKIKWMAFEDQSEKYLFIILSTQTASLLTYCAPPSTPNGWPISALPTPWGHFLYEHWTVLFQCVEHLWIVHDVYNVNNVQTPRGDEKAARATWLPGLKGNLTWNKEGEVFYLIC